jgi:hypothetical protein
MLRTLRDWFLQPRGSVYCAVRTEFLNIIQGNFSLLKRLVNIKFPFAGEKFLIESSANRKNNVEHVPVMPLVRWLNGYCERLRHRVTR